MPATSKEAETLSAFIRRADLSNTAAVDLIALTRRSAARADTTHSDHRSAVAASPSSVAAVPRHKASGREGGSAVEGALPSLHGAPRYPARQAGCPDGTLDVPDSWMDSSTVCSGERSLFRRIRTGRGGAALTRDEAEFVLRYATFRHERKLALAATAGRNGCAAPGEASVGRVVEAFRAVTGRDPSERELRTALEKISLPP